MVAVPPRGLTDKVETPTPFKVMVDCVMFTVVTAEGVPAKVVALELAMTPTALPVIRELLIVTVVFAAGLPFPIANELAEMPAMVFRPMMELVIVAVKLLTVGMALEPADVVEIRFTPILLLEIRD